MKCCICGTEYNVTPCPTCERNRILEEQKRLTREQNRRLEEQNRETARARAEQEKQTKIIQEQAQHQKDQLQWQKDQAEQEKREREQQEYEMEMEIKQKIFDDEFKVREDELFRFASERNLIPFNVYGGSYDLSSFKDFIENIISSNLAGVNKSDNLSNLKVILTFTEISMLVLEEDIRVWRKLTVPFSSDDRFLDATSTSFRWSGKFKLSDIKQTLRSHTADYVILQSTNNVFYIFPLKLISHIDINTGYDGKEIPIDNFPYLFFLHDSEEAQKITLFISKASKRFASIETNLKRIVSDSIAEYEKNNQKPVYSYSESEYIEPDMEAPIEKEKLESYRKENTHRFRAVDSSTSKVSKIICILSGLLALPFLFQLFNTIFWINEIMAIAAPFAITILFSFLTLISRKLGGFLMGLLAAGFTIWFLIEVAPDETFVWIMLATPLVGLGIGFLFPAILNSIDQKVSSRITNEKQSLIQYKLEKHENWKKEQEIAKNHYENKYKESINKWNDGLVDEIIKQVKNFLASQEDTIPRLE